MKMVVVLRKFFFYKIRIIILWFIDLDIEIVFENEFFPYYIFRIGISTRVAYKPYKMRAHIALGIY